MREIKFRVWDKVAKAMSDPFALFGEFTLLGAVFDWQRESGNKKETSLEGLQDLEVMQFTGLKDKNKKEIYDGDILGSGGRVIGHIEGGVRGYCYDVVYLNPTDDKRWSLYSCIGTDYRGDIGVIGNIYEHPELLKH